MCGNRSPGASAPTGTAGVCGSMAAGHNRHSDSRGSRPAGAAVRRRCPRGPVPPPEGRMPQPAGVREGARVQEHLRADRH
ncbi:hypothetical protein NUU61_005905 [Penicillium alfredii]|uniref:Uncharacterized protein n=1 Tax=Penicillium alfredii TaxID=1506179 RepID=A0A9W9FAP5_9EURO|nr:uncharacterized protein NUU61_005868 [Penicillium alfredii]XP_056512049.1 uncharacterized protein NUU61_005879 [Penicillium alfredii]XP_056512050.1 uncharacterized protein NUU61_005885 [Penicillium alfredii]XP_056512052.1 uncharacterized protein NUU61_005899 [Penicillium alfredii]XP_056512054.1 uncharacterized protein NUU61_005905 [Penicillium alfredii]KAJ5096512.1 hypothetical protein NUU61_005868 [Penicillium alfredii]KAJ5096523.1 hypothetical protein NUU61_005879 [Penicillium alfredii]